MTPKRLLSANEFEKIRRLDTCTVSNVIQRFDVRPRNEGFVYEDIQCRFAHFAPMLGYAVAALIRCATPPATSPMTSRIERRRHRPSLLIAEEEMDREKKYDNRSGRRDFWWGGGRDGARNG